MNWGEIGTQVILSIIGIVISVLGVIVNKYVNVSNIKQFAESQVLCLAQ